MLLGAGEHLLAQPSARIRSWVLLTAAGCREIEHSARVVCPQNQENRGEGEREINSGVMSVRIGIDHGSVLLIMNNTQC